MSSMMTKITLDSRVFQHSWASALCKALQGNELLDERNPHDPNTFVGAVGMGMLTRFVCTQWYEYRESNLDKKDSITFNLEGLEIDWGILEHKIPTTHAEGLESVLRLDLEWLSEQEGITIE